MDVKVLNRFRQSLFEARDNLIDWLNTTSERQKQLRLGTADEQAVQDHLQTIDAAIEKASSKTLGLCEVCHDYVGTDFLEMDYTSCVCIDHFSEVERRQLEHELELVQSVQRTLLPQQVPDIPGVEIAAFSRPAQIVGGDYFDFFQFRNGAYGVAIADVAGHGMSASLHMASVQTTLRTLVPEHVSPADVVQQVHHLFHHYIHFTTFVTLFLAAFDPETRDLTYCNAGHNHPLLLRQGGEQADSILWLEPTGPAIGLVDTFQYQMKQISLEPGDILVIYTDGITEAFNHRMEMFGNKRLEALLRSQAHLPAKDLVKMVRQAVEEYIGGSPLEDDTTILILKVTKI